ncbi:hypothetical protein B0T16DRAFT_408777 [Cercophora newfieldiana]|uniref:RecF/RecN/SMC N-terminal domain-containing protein n=1 Tax=Cercophora newfieldiana TaxID=92897 RepID=A0AA39YD22_9PEZI|nr:hypothetical protein B0T16DRAFT_408777 [Cercophora newfieldiana]
MRGRVSNAEAGTSRKRQRFAIADDGEADSDIEVQEARSQLRGDGNKRARISDAGSHKISRRRRDEPTPDSTEEGSDNGSDDGSDAAPSEAAVNEPPSSPPKTQYDALRDGNFEHLAHEAEDDQHATQRLLRFRPERMGDNAVADNAILQSIECINFMCHERLKCNLGPLLNFIVGENGSGKSAVLTAITLCLGGKASSTNRGGSLKSFIKEGCEHARLIVNIKNEGHDAYRPEVYGESIIVERHFSKKGTSGFRVKSATGQTITTKKQEIEEIVEYFALQVDNPLNVLSQDNARQFLNASTKAQKYQFFVEGVQLQQLDNDYRLINENLDGMVAKVPDQEARVKHAEKELSEIKQKMDAMQGNVKIRAKYRVVRGQMVWQQVEAEERRLKTKQDELAECIANVAEMEQQVKEKQTELDAADERITRLEQGIEEAKAEMGTAQEQAQEAELAFKEMGKEVKRLVVEEREAKGSLDNAQQNVKDTQEKIALEERRLEDANGQAHTAKLQDLEEAKKKVEDAKKAVDDNKAAEPRLKELHEEAKKRVALKEKEFSSKKNEITFVDEKIRALERNMRSLYDGYEAAVPRLVKAINENEHRFKHKPIGPLGAHIQLLKPQWSAILETTLGKNLNGFLVSNNEDSKVLAGMMRNANVRDCPIFVSKNRQELNLNGHEPDESFDTILRVLKFDNNLVRDQLILSNMIEQVVLTPERTHGEKIMFDGSPPRNVKAVICFQTGTRGNGLRLTENHGNLGSSPIQIPNNLRPRMQGDTGSETVFLKEQYRQLESEYRALEGERRRLAQEVQRCDTDVKRNKAERNKLEAKARNAQVAVEHVEQDLDQFDGVDGRLQNLKEQLAEYMQERDHHGLQYGALRVKKTAQNAELEELVRRKREAVAQFEDAKERVNKVERKHKQKKDGRRVILTDLHSAIASVELFKERVTRKEEQIRAQQATIDEFTEGAIKIAPTRLEIPEGETYESLEKLYKTLEKRILEAEKRQGMSEAEINKAFVEKTEAKKREVGILNSILEVNQGLKQTLNIRLEKWRNFQRHITAQSRSNFQYLLAERGFRGKLLFDHRRKLLDLQVEPDKTEKRTEGRSTKTLSGGEKSFSSICLLLSIWEAMGSPLRCLDEFDVFMDNVNRAISTNMLITAARRSVNRQYIFITPNAIEGRAKLDKDVKIIRLTDPRQRRLDNMQ